MRGKRFYAKTGHIAKVINWDHNDKLYICRYPWGEMFYASAEQVEANLVKEE